MVLLLSTRINEKEMTKDCKYNFRINELPDKRTFGHINLKTTDFGLSIRLKSLGIGDDSHDSPPQKCPVRPHVVDDECPVAVGLFNRKHGLGL